MKDFFELITSSTIASAIFIIVFCLIVIVIISIYLTAFIQGREIAFWPPKVGEKPIKSSEKGGTEATEITGHSTAVRFPVQVGEMLIASSHKTYTIQSVFYGGAASTLFKGKDEDEKEVIVKVYWRGLRPNSSPWEYFQRELRASEMLSHRNIVQILDRGISGGYPFIVMEYLAGGTLREMLDSHDRIPGQQILSIAEQVSEAIDYAHSHGLIHRDIKPGNILFESDAYGRVALSDFGVAQIMGSVEHNITAISSFYGAASYLSPESISSGDTSKASDIYSFAVILFEMITGQSPFGDLGDVYAILHTKVQKDAPGVQMYRSVPDELAERIRRSLSREPAQRPKNTRSLLTGIEHFIQEL